MLKKINMVCSPPGPEAKKWLARWTTCSPKPVTPSVFSKSEGMYIKDIDGNVFLDFASQATNLGHNNPRVMEAMCAYAEMKGYGGSRFKTTPLIELHEKILEIVPPGLQDGLLTISPTSSLAGEDCIKLTRAITGKPILISFLGGHYGGSLGVNALDASSSKFRRHMLPVIPNVLHVPYPYCYRCPFAQEYPNCNLTCFDFIQYTFDRIAHPEETAAFMIEPLQQMGGVMVPPKEYFPKLRKLCDEHSILLVDDEASLCLGRTGKMWGIDHWNVTPDLMFFGKALSNGTQAISAVVGKRELMEKETKLGVVHMGSLGSKPIYCVAALAAIQEVQDKNLADNAAKIGSYLMKRLNELAETHELIGDVRGLGLCIGIELVKDQRSKEPAKNETKKVGQEALKRGLYVAAGIGVHNQVIRLTPPLIVTKAEADTAIEILEEAIKEVE